MPSRPKLEPCALVIIDGPKATINASFNPKEISIDKSVPWQKHKDSKGDSPHLEFTAAEPKTLSVELFFDTYESGKDVFKTKIQLLEKATLIMEGGSEEDKRPPRVQISWGNFPAFAGVVESLAVKYTMFFPDGTPCRATASLKLKQAKKATAVVPPPKQPAGGGGGGGGGEGASGASTTPGSDGSDPRPGRS